MTTCKSILLVLAVTTFAATGHAAAANVACPAAGDIRELKASDDGVPYEARVGDNVWKGEVSKYDNYTVKVTSLTFQGSLIPKNHDFVACDYHGEGESSLRMTIETATPWVPATPSAWTGKKGEMQECKGSDIAACEFKSS